MAGHLKGETVCLPACLSSAVQILPQTEKQALKGLDKKEQKTLMKLLSRIEDNLSSTKQLDRAVQAAEERDDEPEPEETEDA